MDVKEFINILIINKNTYAQKFFAILEQP